MRFHGKNDYANPPLINVVRISCILFIEQLLHSCCLSETFKAVSKCWQWYIATNAAEFMKPNISNRVAPPPPSHHWSSCWTTCLCFRLTFVNVTSQDHLKRVIFSGLLCRNDINTGRCDGFRVECVCYHKLLSFLWTATASLLAQYLQHCFVVYLNRWYAQTVFSLTETTVNERRIFLLLLMTQCYLVCENSAAHCEVFTTFLHFQLLICVKMFRQVAGNYMAKQCRCALFAECRFIEFKHVMRLIIVIV